MSITDDNQDNSLLGSIIGIFIGDAIAVPYHWYYSLDVLNERFKGEESLFNKQVVNNDLLHHPDSWKYYSKLITSDEPYDIFHKLATHYSKQGLHYHQFLQPGEYTITSCLVEKLLENLCYNKIYDSGEYLEKYINFFLNEGNHRDTYIETPHRMFFRNLSKGNSLDNCGYDDDCLSGLVVCLPLMIFGSDLDVIKQHMFLTHASPRLVIGAQILIDAIHSGELKNYQEQFIKLYKMMGEDGILNTTLAEKDETIDLEYLMSIDEKEILNLDRLKNSNR